MQEFFYGTLFVIVYFILCASSALLVRVFLPVEQELFRKILHFILLGSLPVWTIAFSTWYLAALSSLLFAAAVYPLLSMGEHIKGYSHLLVERKGGEIKHSLLIVFFMFSLVISVCWGLMDDKLLAIASVLAWGVGDAAAALIGKRFGKHPLNIPLINGRKSAEGTAAMFVCSFLCVLTVLLLRGGMPWYSCGIAAILTGAVSAAVELYTPNGMDTITCPLAAMTVLIPLVTLLGGAV